MSTHSEILAFRLEKLPFQSFETVFLCKIGSVKNIQGESAFGVFFLLEEVACAWRDVPVDDISTMKLVETSELNYSFCTESCRI